MQTKIDFGNNDVTVKASTIVTLVEYFSLNTLDGPVDFQTEVKCDFADIPEKYHEVCLNMLTVKYLNNVSFGNNPFSECKPIVKRKWWQFWKSKYFESKHK